MPACAWLCRTGREAGGRHRGSGGAPAGLSVAKIDFKRGDDGAGRLIVQFDGQGAVPDLRTQATAWWSMSVTLGCRPTCRSR